MAGTAQPLNTAFPLVNPDGTPTEYFIRWAQQFSGNTLPVDGITAGNGIDVQSGPIISLDAGLDDLNDVDISTVPPTINQKIGWDGTMWVPQTVSGGGAGPSALFEDQKAAGTVGGGSSAGSWNTRTLNTTVFDDIGATLSSNEVALPAGSYFVDATAPFFRGDRTRTRLQDVTNGATLLLSEDTYEASSTNSATVVVPRILGRFTLVSPANVSLQYRVQTSHASNGLGIESNFGVTEIYSRVLLTKIA